MFAGLLSGREVAPLAKPQHHVEEAEALVAVGDRIVLASDGADTNAPEREDAGFDGGAANQLHDRGHVDAPIEIG